MNTPKSQPSSARLYRGYKTSTSIIRVKLREALRDYHSRTGERITYGRLAKMTGLSRQTLESLSSRPGYNTTLVTVAKLCRALDCQPGDLLVLDREDSGDDSH